MTSMKSESIKAESMKVQLLGIVQATSPTGIVHFLPDKRYQLLAYLAYKNEWVNRDELAFLFWSDVANETSRHSLRQLLKRLKILSLPEGLEIERERLRWQVPTDVLDFKKALIRKDYAMILESAGRLLKGLESDEVNEFNTWLLHERESLHSRWREALLRYTKDLEEHHQTLEATRVLARLLEDDLLDEDVLQAYLRMAALANQHQQALNVYQAFVKRLHHELDLNPTSLTEQLVQKLQTQSREPSIMPISKQPTLPVSATPFVGRNQELAKITQLLARPDCRLLTLIGPGGMGKTRMALQVAKEVQTMFPQGVYFVPLEALTTKDAIPIKIAEVIGLDLQAKDLAFKQVLKVLESKHLLLILDNYEHLSDAAMLTVDLIHHCPSLKLLVTSRERLHVEEEWLYTLEGLHVPAKGEVAEIAVNTDAAQLFLERARRVRPDFVVTDADLPYLVEICNFVEGSPLALELAAVWVRVMSLAELMQELTKNLDLLQSQSRNRSERHQSLRAVFEQSWQRLSAKEQDALSGLTVFQGGFKREAARVITHVAVAFLVALVDKSLLRVSATGYYDVHPLVYEYASQKLSDTRKEYLHLRYGKYYQYLLTRHHEAIQQGRQKDVFAELQGEWENIQAVMMQSVRDRRLDDLRHWLELMDTYFDSRGALREGLEFLKQAEAILDPAIADERDILSQVLTGSAWYHFRLGLYDKAKEIAQQTLTLLSTPGLSTTGLSTTGSLTRGRNQRWVSILNTLGLLERRMGNTKQSILHFEKALEYARASQEDELIVRSLANLAATLQDLGQFEQAEANFLEALGLYRERGMVVGLVRELNNLGWLYYSQKNLVKAKPLFEEGLALARDIGSKQNLPYFLNNLAYIAFDEGRYQEALELNTQALNLAEQTGEKAVQAEILAALTRNATHLDLWEQAKSYSNEAIGVASSVGYTVLLLQAVLARAELLAKQNDILQAAGICYTVLHHKSATPLQTTMAKDLLTHLEPMVSAKDLACVTGDAKITSLAIMVESLLKQEHILA